MIKPDWLIQIENEIKRVNEGGIYYQGTGLIPIGQADTLLSALNKAYEDLKFTREWFAENGLSQENLEICAHLDEALTFNPLEVK